MTKLKSPKLPRIPPAPRDPWKTRTRNKITIFIIAWIGLTIWIILAGWFFRVPGAADILKVFLGSAVISGTALTAVNYVIVGIEKIREGKESKEKDGEKKEGE